MPVLLLVYQMLQNMSPHCCDMSPSRQGSNPGASHSCEVKNLFGEAAAHLQLEEPYSAVLTFLSYSKSKDEEAQSVHLGLCCVSSVRTHILIGEIKIPEVESRCKNYKNLEEARWHAKGISHPVKNACALKLGFETMLHFCNVCNLAVKLKDADKIHEKGRDVHCGFKCVYCRMTELDLMEDNLESCKQIKETYQYLICKTVLLCHKVLGKCPRTAVRGSLISFSAQCIHHLLKLNG